MLFVYIAKYFEGASLFGTSEPHFEVETLATVSLCPSLSRNNRNNVIPDARTDRWGLEPSPPLREIRYGDSENHSPDEQRQRGGAILKGRGYDVIKNFKCLNQHKNWHGSFGVEISNIDVSKTLSKGAGTFEGL